MRIRDLTETTSTLEVWGDEPPKSGNLNAAAIQGIRDWVIHLQTTDSREIARQIANNDSALKALSKADRKRAADMVDQARMDKGALLFNQTLSGSAVKLSKMVSTAGLVFAGMLGLQGDPSGAGIVAGVSFLSLVAQTGIQQHLSKVAGRRATPDAVAEAIWADVEKWKLEQIDYWKRALHTIDTVRNGGT